MEPPPPASTSESTGGSTSGSAREVALVFLRLGTIAFGGPAAHTAMMREELVRRRAWVSDRRFADLMGATNLIPGPNSTELAIHLGHERAGWRGLLLAGLAFILPAALMVTGLAWAYVEHGDTPAIEGILYGVVPVVVAIIAWALFGLGRTVLDSPWLVVLAVLALTAYLLGVNELVVLFGGAAIAALARGIDSLSGTDRHHLLGWPLLAGAPVFADPTGNQLAQLFWTMLKIGAVLYGGGYVILAFLEGDFVDRLGWVTREQVLDAVSMGQVTPGPVFTTATFLGYVVAGFPGAFLATVAIFLPSFVFVSLLTRLTDWLRSRSLTSALLDGVNATALALMAGVSLQLGRSGLVDLTTIGLAAATLVLLWRTKLNSAWFIGGGALVGVLAGVT
ncbi:chromate transporter [Nocardioides sp. Root190]|uniref:chromate efflux transporter n=1 Tax=Nocardioides sp. Root190 TaxID=1736488 RepID=UPI0006FD81C2|nr:chromate efflux transporter [Nocardioides sp. Root190]KRB77334.1 chromate transporter [Nocardioides sp. Root190]